MYIKIGDVVPYLMAARSILVANSVAVKAYYKKYALGWQATVLDAQILACTEIITAHILKNTNKSETVVRNDELDFIMELIDDCELFVEAGVEDGSIAVGVGGFGFDRIREGCRDRKVGVVHEAYLATTDVVAANQGALTALGYLPGRWGVITSSESSAYVTMEFKIDLKTEIRELSAGNIVIIKRALRTVARLIRVLHAFAVYTGDKEMAKRTTQRAVMGSVSPATARKARFRFLEEGESVCVQSRPVLKNIVQVTLMSEEGEAMIGRKANKTGIVTDGIVLEYNTKVSKKFMEFPGVLKTDRCLVISNTGRGRIRVLFYTVRN